MADHRTLKAWTEARLVVQGVLRASQDHWRPWAGAVFGQLQRASLSVQLNIAEGWSFSASPTCTRHLGIAYGSAIEAADLIELMIDSELLPKELGEDLRRHSVQCQRLLVGLLKRRRPLS
ncbi:MAG TPA: four helix bundle protein [Gemmatimonadales bacterium]|nr:four helix bundle protein [Gemmatimonadales bacterium]